MTTPGAKAAKETAKFVAKTTLAIAIGQEIGNTFRALKANTTSIKQAELTKEGMIESAKITAKAQVQSAKIGAKASVQAAETNASATYYSSDVSATSCYNKINVSFFDYIVNCFSVFEISLVCGLTFLLIIFLLKKINIT